MSMDKEHIIAEVTIYGPGKMAQANLVEIAEWLRNVTEGVQLLGSGLSFNRTQFHLIRTDA